jgi:UDP-N-acetylglucosamine--N-acetylmuramyl-(pentapeptide) pyrophosphoryl-undecaprenol N-acetylglucosamine transferase
VSAPQIVIAAGGTAGHVVPAIAVADALRAEGAEVHFAGGERAEAELVPAAGYEIDRLNVEGISRTNPLKAIRALLKAGAAMFGAARLLRRRRADAVLGGGGYAAGPIGLAAVLRGTPLVLTEADSHLGLTNRLLANRAHRVCLAFPIEGRNGDRYLLTGRPVPPTVTDRAGARAEFGIEPGELTVLIFGGSLGARSINHAAIEAFADAPYRILHVPGRRDFAELSAPGPHYVLRDYVVPFGKALAAADLAVARAGGSVFELAQYSLPSVLIPYPHASGNHQEANARWMEQAGAATILPDAELTPERLRAKVDTLVEDDARRREMALAAAALARPDAARTIAQEILAAVEHASGAVKRQA